MILDPLKGGLLDEGVFEFKVCCFSNYVYFVDLKLKVCKQETPLVTGLVVAAGAYAGRYGILAWQAFKARPAGMRKFYEGGFKAIMDKREAARILGVRYCHFFPLIFSNGLVIFEFCS